MLVESVFEQFGQNKHTSSTMEVCGCSPPVLAQRSRYQTYCCGPVQLSLCNDLTAGTLSTSTQDGCAILCEELDYLNNLNEILLTVLFNQEHCQKVTLSMDICREKNSVCLLPANHYFLGSCGLSSTPVVTFICKAN